MLISEITTSFSENSAIEIELNSIGCSKIHYHPNSLELIYCVKGNVVLHVNNEIYEIQEGGLSIVENSDTHYLESSADNIIMSLYIDLSKTNYRIEEIQYIFFLCSSDGILPHQQHAMKKIKDLMLLALYFYISGNKEKLNYENSLSIANSLLDFIVKHFCYFIVEDLTEEDNRKYNERLNATITYIQKHFNEKITLDDLSKTTHLNKNYFSQFMKRTTFRSFTKMVMYIRCLEVDKLLLRTNYSIEQISEICGFSTKKYMYKAFKSFYGCTPGQFRQKSRDHLTHIYETPVEIDDELKSLIAERIIEHVSVEIL